MLLFFTKFLFPNKRESRVDPFRQIDTAAEHKKTFFFFRVDMKCRNAKLFLPIARHTLTPIFDLFLNFFTLATRRQTLFARYLSLSISASLSFFSISSLYSILYRCFLFLPVCLFF